MWGWGCCTRISINTADIHKFIEVFMSSSEHQKFISYKLLQNMFGMYNIIIFSVASLITFHFKECLMVICKSRIELNLFCILKGYCLEFGRALAESIFFWFSLPLDHFCFLFSGG